MGTPHSTPEKQEVEQPEAAAVVVHFRRLYADLTAPDDTGSPSDDKMFRNRFENYFGEPYLELGHLLYVKLFGSILPVDEEMFVSAMTLLERLSSKHGDHHEAEAFYFTVFSGGEEAIDRQTLTKILHVAATFALVVGSELHERAVVPKDHFLLQAIVSAAMQHADKTAGQLHKAQFAVWVSSHCPRLLEGVQHWMLSLLHGHHEHQHEAASAPQDNDVMMYYQLPTPHLEGESQLVREVEICTLVWALSTLLPLVYMGHKEDGKKHAKASGHHAPSFPIGGVWTLLYSSNQHGFSMNRFQHHCSDYREPSIMLLTCQQEGGGEQLTFAIAVDTEWRDGTYFWGGENFCFLQLQPSFAMLKSGPKLLSLNEKQRGFPTGLRVMSSDKYDLCLLHVESSLEKAHFQGMELDVKVVEVWGCGGVEAADSQRRVKSWESREILRRRKIKTSGLKETWMDSPDRYLLELGGVATKRPTEQQQQ